MRLYYSPCLAVEFQVPVKKTPSSEHDGLCQSVLESVLMFEPYEIGPFECGYCGNIAPFKVAAENSEITSEECEEDDELWGRTTRIFERGWVYRMLICSICKKATFDRVFHLDGLPEDDETLYPEPISVPVGLPNRVANEFKSALLERRRNPNGYAALLGRVLDAVCADRGIPNNQAGKLVTLGSRVKILVAKDKLSAVQGAVGLRNIAAHADLGSLVPDDVQYLETLVRYILDHLYVIPEVNRKASQRKQQPTTNS
jgi:hypothetical protein